MFVCKLDELTSYIDEEFPYIVPDNNISQSFVDIINMGNFGDQESMGIKWIRQKISLIDADSIYISPLYNSEHHQYPKQLTLLKMKVEGGGAIAGFIPKKESRSIDTYGRFKTKKTFIFNATDKNTATKLAIITTDGLAKSWLYQFE